MNPIIEINDKGLPVMNNASMPPINPNGITERTIKQDLKLLNSRIKAATKANRVNKRIAPNPENDRCWFSVSPAAFQVYPAGSFRDCNLATTSLFSWE